MGSMHHLGGHPLLTEWELWQMAARLKAVTIGERLRVIALFALEAGCNPATAQPIEVMRWLASHAADWSESTAATYHSYLRAWFKWLVLMDHRIDNPMAKLGTPKYPDRIPRPVPDDGLARLLLTRMHHRTRVMILLASLGGLRVHEIAKFRGEDIDLMRRVFYVAGKGGSREALPLHPLLAEAALTMPERGWWFPSNNKRPGQHVHSKGVSDIIGQTMRRAGTPGTPHSLRHWFGTTLLDDGEDVRVVQTLLRHKQLSTTAIYTKVPDERRHAAVNRLDPFRAARPRLVPVDDVAG
ncbi:integrase [Mycobacteroides saopaulense]|uniref:Integrase n=2 Tax=Mycobacteroides saopaulense TaxID=1578165 RepID=A0A1X0IJE0_9MYCO|nr:integrase [Mycobacteroides saopaulense]